MTLPTFSINSVGARENALKLFSVILQFSGHRKWPVSWQRAAVYPVDIALISFHAFECMLVSFVGAGNWERLREVFLLDYIVYWTDFYSPNAFCTLKIYNRKNTSLFFKLPDLLPKYKRIACQNTKRFLVSTIKAVVVWKWN